MNINDIIDEYQIDVDFVASKLGLDVKQKGSYYFASCPMSDHDDKNPSAYYKAGDKYMYCPGCVKSIGIITMIEEQEGLEFKEACRWLEDAVGITEDQKKSKRRIHYAKDIKEINKGMKLVRFCYPSQIAVDTSNEKKFSVKDFMSEKEKKVLLMSMARNNAQKALAAKGYAEFQGIQISNMIDEYVDAIGKFYKVVKK